MSTLGWNNVVSTLCNVVSTLFQRRALALYQRCATLKNRRRILFHFQRRINVISTLIHNVETTLIRRWNVGWGKIPTATSTVNFSLKWQPTNLGFINSPDFQNTEEVSKGDLHSCSAWINAVMKSSATVVQS